MTHISNTVVAVVLAAALSLVAACGELEAPDENIGSTVDKTSKSPAPKGRVRDHAVRMDYGDGEATLPAEPKPSKDGNASRLDFGDNGRP